jgi:quercetin dioxygenase-like cupin family protein
MPRSDALADFITQVGRGITDAFAPGQPGHAVAQRMRLALDTVPPQPGGPATPPCALPACRHLDTALALARAAGPAPLGAWAEAFAAVAPSLHWVRSQRRGTEAFHQGHANTEIVGPAGLEQRSDVVLGASLLAPGVVYPDHDHPPEEIYLVLSAGDWFNRKRGWYTPGAGGAVHHPPGIVHAMRAGATPLLAIWCLWPGP